jgi:outer membrane receptor protein involved in Fe transport
MGAHVTPPAMSRGHSVRAPSFPFGIAIGASALAVVCTPAIAQDQSAESAAAPLETIVVTGSRIVVPGVAVSNPVTSIDAEAIRTSGVTDLTDYLKTTPALVSSTDKTDAGGSNAFIGSTGLTLLNLRNLGVDRTLVLVDGRRHVAGLPGSAAVDIDTIPFALIERIDVQTGGASALYGADGVSGVVNFILKRDFEGVDVRAQYGSSSQGDADTVLVSAVLGENVDDGRGNVTVALEYSKEQRLRANERDYAGGGRGYTFHDNPTTSASTIRTCRTKFRCATCVSGTPVLRAPSTPTSISSRISVATIIPGTSATCRSRP